MLRFDLEKIRSDLALMSRPQLACLGVLQLRRMAPNFEYFALETGWRGVGRLNLVIAIAIDFIEFGTSRSMLISENEVSEIGPDTEEFSSIYASAALDASSAACHLLRFLEGHGAEEIAQLMSLGIDTVDIFVQNSGSEINDDDIEKHELVQGEIQSQLQDIELVSSDNFVQKALEICLIKPEKLGI